MKQAVSEPKEASSEVKDEENKKPKYDKSKGFFDELTTDDRKFGPNQSHQGFNDRGGHRGGRGRGNDQFSNNILNRFDNNRGGRGRGDFNNRSNYNNDNWRNQDRKQKYSDKLEDPNARLREEVKNLDDKDP